MHAPTQVDIITVDDNCLLTKDYVNNGIDKVSLIKIYIYFFNNTVNIWL